MVDYSQLILGCCLLGLGILLLVRKRLLKGLLRNLEAQKEIIDGMIEDLEKELCDRAVDKKEELRENVLE